ncbi:hypothetical protein PQ462_06735 [Flavobacterium sp. KACC 22758]|jgi:hypothetical protein|uniref:hypothetical protein n=1 Tax=Flavobacterium sp. KACC 22758 TaxID=3025667 RepID=UPI0023655DF7|nr:hypothetical protein [Flavobacterium sp. KACC 22758]WDF61057.1 hypothetical protein PQ462_06735 [Flavobacterium sp. KACC 22758]
MNKYESFIEAFLDFNETTCSNKGFDKNKFEKTCSLLSDLKPIIQESKSVPLNLANVFIDLYSSIESCAYKHEGEMRQKILYSADKLAAIARDVTES